MHTDSLFIAPDAHCRNVTGPASAAVYTGAWVEDTALGERATVGDFSRVADSVLAERASLQRYNMAYGARLGRYSYTGRNTVIWHADIGAFCSLSWNVSVGGGEHDYTRLTTHSFLYDEKDFGLMPPGAEGYDRFAQPCSIGNDVWIGAGAVITRGVHVGDGAVIGAGSVVTRDVEPYTVVAGVPARPLKKRFSDDIIRALLASRWWDLPGDVIRANFELFNAPPDSAAAARLLALRDKYLGGEGK